MREVIIIGCVLGLAIVLASAGKWLGDKVGSADLKAMSAADTAQKLDSIRYLNQLKAEQEEACTPERLSLSARLQPTSR